MIVITHHDADGTISLALLFRKVDVEKVYFTSPANLLRTLGRVLYEQGEEKEIIITDLSGNQKHVNVASVFKKVIWLDHHVWENVNTPNNVEIYVKPYNSAVKVVAEYFNLNDDISRELVKIAEEIDSNNLKSEKAYFLRDLIAAFKWKYQRSHYEYLYLLAKELSDLGLKALDKEQYKELVKEYRSWLQSKILDIILRSRPYEVSGNKVLIIRLNESIPTFFVYEVISNRIEDKFDYIFVVYENPKGTRIEIRTQTGKEVLPIARKLGGGGHKYAAGVTLRRKVKDEEILEAIG